MAAIPERLDVAVTTPAVHVRKLMLDYTDENTIGSSISIYVARFCFFAPSAA